MDQSSRTRLFVLATIATGLVFLPASGWAAGLRDYERGNHDGRFFQDAGGIQHGFVGINGTNFTTVDDIPGGVAQPVNQLLALK